jgi:hypothetical protein
VARRVSGEGGCADQFECGVSSVPEDGVDLAGDVAVADEHVVCADAGERGARGGVAGGGQDGHAALPGQHRGGHADRGGAAADQDGLPGVSVESDGERPVGGLQHFRDRADGRPAQFAAERDDLAGRHAGVLGVAAAEHAAHSAHHRGDLPAGRELPAGAPGDHPGRFDAGHPGERDSLGQAEPGVQLRAVEPERLDLDEHPAWRRGGYG